MKRLAGFLIGAAVGIGLAMLIGWVLFPLDRQEITPASMRADYQAEYLRLVADSFGAEGDLASAEQRLRVLGADPYTEPLVELVERWIREERSADLVAPLVQLARALDVETPAMEPYLSGGRQ